MTILSFNLFFIWLLPVTADAALITPHHTFTDVTTDNVTANQFSQGRVTTQELPGLNAVITTPSIAVDVNPKEEQSKSLLQVSQTTPFESISTENQTTANPTYSISPQFNTSPAEVMSMADKQIQVTQSATTTVTNNSSTTTTTSRPPPVFSSITQSQSTQSTIKGDENTHGSTQPIATQTTFVIKPKTTSTTTVTGGDTMQSSTLYRTSPAATKISTRHIHTTKKSTTEKSSQGINHTNAVAGIIGGALVLMMVGFLVIFIKKLHVQKQHITTKEWAGPSPFLQDGADSGNVPMRSNNQISIISFLPQRLSKRFSMIAESQQELEEFTPGTTFGDEHQGDGSVHQVNGSDVKESKETVETADLEAKHTGETAETVSVPSSQTNSQEK